MLSLTAQFRPWFAARLCISLVISYAHVSLQQYMPCTRTLISMSSYYSLAIIALSSYHSSHRSFRHCTGRVHRSLIPRRAHRHLRLAAFILGLVLHYCIFLFPIPRISLPPRLVTSDNSFYTLRTQCNIYYTLLVVILIRRPIVLP